MSQGKTFSSFGQFLRELGWMLFHPVRIIRVFRGKSVDPRLRERVMLAVTEVNRCSLCAWAHSRAALREGIEEDEVRQLLGGTLDAVPPEQRTAVLFAQHWADRRGVPDPDARVHFEAAYDRATVDALDTAMRAIRFFNYFNVLMERIVRCVSLGRLGRGWSAPSTGTASKP